MTPCVTDEQASIVNPEGSMQPLHNGQNQVLWAKIVGSDKTE